MHYQQPVTLQPLPSSSSSSSSIMGGKGIIRIYYKDNSYKSFCLQEEVTAQEVCELFAWNFLHLEKKVADHFSLRVIIDGKDIRQLKGGDRPLRIQKDLLALKIAWNTDQNYFLFCLSEETKRRITTRIIPPGLPPAPVPMDAAPVSSSSSSSKEKDKLTKNSDPSGQKLSTRKKLSFLVPRRLTTSPFHWKHQNAEDKKQDKPYLPQSQSVPQVSLSPHTFMRTKSEQTMTSSGDSTIQRQEVSIHLKKLIIEEKKKLRLSNSMKTDDGNTKGKAEGKADSEASNNHKNNGTIETTKELATATATTTVATEASPSPTKTTEKREELAVHTPTRKDTGAKEIKKEASLPPVFTDAPTICISEEPVPNVSPIVTRSVSMPKIKAPEEDEIARMFDNLFDWYDKPSARKPKEEESKRENADDMDDETFDNILATLKTLEQLDAK